MLLWLSRIISSVLGTKVFLSGVFTVIIGVVLYNLLVTTIQEIMTFSINQISGADMGSVTSPTISGFAGWFLAQIKIPECVSVIVSCVTIRFILRKIPFLRW